MGSYGIGVSRAVAAVAEGTCDDKGLCWPRELAPFDVQIVVAGKGEDATAFAGDLAAELDRTGIKVLLDDRKASPGVKFADAELLGMPTSVVIGRSLADGVIEVRDRASGRTRRDPRHRSRRPPHTAAAQLAARPPRKTRQVCERPLSRAAVLHDVRTRTRFSSG